MTRPIDIVTWNAEWRSRSRLGDIIREHVWASNPQVVCLTEAHLGFAPDGYIVSSSADYGYPQLEGRRKVIPWSRQPWREVDTAEAEEMPPGRFVSAITQTSLGALKIIGVCIPWSAAHVSSGRKDRSPWQDHIAYLQAIAIPVANSPSRTVLLGDFNQTVPCTRAPAPAFDALDTAILRPMTLASGDIRDGDDRLLIDHLAHSPDLEITGLAAIPRRLPDGTVISDHTGLRATTCAR